jgi:hypothetical protein
MPLPPPLVPQTSTMRCLVSAFWRKFIPLRVGFSSVPLGQRSLSTFCSQRPTSYRDLRYVFITDFLLAIIVGIVHNKRVNHLTGPGDSRVVFYCFSFPLMY